MSEQRLIKRRSEATAYLPIIDFFLAVKREVDDDDSMMGRRKRVREREQKNDGFYRLREG